MLKELFTMKERKIAAQRKWVDCLSGVAIDSYVPCQVYGKAIKELLTEDKYADWKQEDINKMLLTYAYRLIEAGDKCQKRFGELSELHRNLC